MRYIIKIVWENCLEKIISIIGKNGMKGGGGVK